MFAINAFVLFAALAPLGMSETQGLNHRTRDLQQLAGVGAGCDSVFTQTDNSVGYGVENAENNVAGDITSGGKSAGRRMLTKGSFNRKLKQLAGVGSGCNSVFTQTDNSVGYGVENAENNAAGDVTAMTGRKLSGERSLLQMNKVVNGAATVMDAAGLNQQAAVVQPIGDNVDGDLTNDAATTGQEVGQLEDDTIEPAGMLVPGRKLSERSLLQMNKVVNGAAPVMDAAGLNQQAAVVQPIGDNVDGDLTNDAATAGQEVGQLEDDTIEPAGELVPGR